MPANLAEILVPVAGSLTAALVAGVASYLAGRGMRSHDWRLGIARERLAERQRLYARFVAESDRNLLVANDAGKALANVMPLFSSYAEISLLGSEPVREAAKRMCDLALAANARGQDADAGRFHPAREAFIVAARAELASIEGAAARGKRPSN